MEEYLLFLIFINHIPVRDTNKKMYKLEVTHSLRYTRTSSRDGNEDAVYDTLSAVRETVTPHLKRTFSLAASNLLEKNRADNLFVEVLFHSLGSFCEPDSSFGFIAFDFEVLQRVIESPDASRNNKQSALRCMNALTGIDKPARKIIIDLLIDYRDRFKRDDGILELIIYGFMDNDQYTEAVRTLTYLTNNWSQGDYFEHDIAAALQPHRYPNHYDVTIDKVLNDMLPRMSDPVQKRFIKVLKQYSVSQGEFETASNIMRLNFPVTPDQKERIDKLTV